MTPEELNRVIDEAVVRQSEIERELERLRRENLAMRVYLGPEKVELILGRQL